ncbi:MAG: ROK family protein [Bacteroidia bacterium]|nr:ROK family protein [Bacteroidia bacterium]
MKEVAIGIDIGGTNTVLGVVDKKGNCIAKDSIVTCGYGSVDKYIETIAEKIKELLSAIGTQCKVKGIGIGAPNGNCKRGTIEYAPNLKWKGIIPISESLCKYFDFPVLVTNDANAAAIGEMVYGSAKKMKDFIVVTLGTGLGSGFVSGGKLLCGHNGFAGELGHTIAVIDGRSCGCGRKGCLETYVSATGITRTVIEMLGKNKTKSILRNYSNSNINSKRIYEAALQKDKLALEAFEFTGKMLGLKLSDTVAITNPEAIFLFGGLAKAGDLIFKPTKEAMDNNMLNIFKNSCALLPSGIDENNAAVLGAASLIWKANDM